MPKSHASTDLSAYAPVADRIELFYQKYPSGRIATELVSRDRGQVTFKASVFREAADGTPAATGWASEREGDGDINTVACLENTETSAIGRALANLGFAASARRPSREEMYKAERARGRVVAYPSSSASLRVIRERESAVLQNDANAALDLVELLASCERQGFSSARAQAIRVRVNTIPAMPATRVARIEARLRQWLRANVHPQGL